MGMLPIYFLLLAFIFVLAKERRFSLVPTTLFVVVLAYVLAPSDAQVWVAGAAGAVLVLVLIYASVMGARRYVATQRQVETMEQDLRQEVGLGATSAQEFHKAH
jgi:hypothetical protein